MSAPRLRRLLPKREAEAQLQAFLPLLEGHATWLLDEEGRPLAQTTESAAEGVGLTRLPLQVAGQELGCLLISPPPGSALAEAAATALLAGLERSANEAMVRRELAAETLERYREVNLLYRLGDVLVGGGLDPTDLPERVLDEAMRAVDADAAWLVLDAAPGEEAVLVARGLAETEDPAALLRSARAGFGDEGRTIILGAEDPDASALLWSPLRVQEHALGGLLLRRGPASGMFTAGDAKLLSSLAGQAAAIIDNARLHQAALEQARMSRELQLAYEVQSQLMPTSLPPSPGLGWRVAAEWLPAREVAGDFYDATLSGDQLTVAVGDVADKGMAAALFMALTRSTLRASASSGREAAEVVARANALLCADAHDGMFVTLAYAMLHPDGRVQAVNAGHNPPLLLRADGRVETLAKTGILIGWDPEAGYAQTELRMEIGDTLLLYTDGVTEALDGTGRAYGEERLEAMALRHRQEGADALLAALLQDLAGFVGEAEAFDDVTMLVVTRLDPGAAPVQAMVTGGARRGG